MKWRKSLFILGSLSLILILSACGQSKIQSHIKEVAVLEVAMEKGEEQFESYGTLQGGEEVTISFVVSGVVQDISVENGSKVNPGDIVANLDVNSVPSKTLVEKTKLASPVAGTILAIYAAQDQPIEAGAPAFKIANIEKLRVVLPIPDYEISKWRVGDKITAKLSDGEKDGRVTKIVPAPKGTRIIQVEVGIDNQENDWLPGQQVSCVHSVEGKDGIYVPLDAVVSNGNTEPYVFVVKGDQAVKTPVQQGSIFGEKIEIFGLNPGDRIVVKGANQLFHNDTIKVIGSL